MAAAASTLPFAIVDFVARSASKAELDSVHQVMADTTYKSFYIICFLIL
jgi:hypothetical protein